MTYGGGAGGFSSSITTISGETYRCGPAYVSFEKPWMQDRPIVRKVIFNPPATIILWEDGSKTVVKCAKGDRFDPEKGFLMAYGKKFYGAGFYRFVKREIASAEMGWANILKGIKNAKE